MKTMTYEEVYELCKKFARLSPTQRKVVELLWLVEEGVFEGNYNDLAKALGKKDAPNIRKTVLQLEKMGLICIVCAKSKESEKYDNALKKLLDKGMDYDNAINLLNDLGFENKLDDEGNWSGKQRRIKALFLVDGWMEMLLNN